MTNNLIFVNRTMKKTVYFEANIEDYFPSKKPSIYTSKT